MKLPKELSVIREEMVCDLYDKGYKVRDIAIQQDIAQSTVYDILNAHKKREVRKNSTPNRRKETIVVDMSIDYRVNKKLRNELIYRLRAYDKRPIKEIAKIFNIHCSVVTRVMKDQHKRGWIKCLDQ